MAVKGKPVKARRIFLFYLNKLAVNCFEGVQDRTPPADYCGA